jgi:predicted ATPase
MLYVLLQLINIYKSYSIYDRGLKQFVEVCNHYLNDKKLVYDEVGLDLYIQFNDEKTKSEIGFDLLSSGEKQIISMLSEVFLDPDNNFIFLIDEPELSLSIFWQKMLIPDIMKSGRCSLLFAVTHSPYIFDNEYDSCAVGMNEFVEFNKNEK